jgi:hypothetical protein
MSAFPSPVASFGKRPQPFSTVTYDATTDPGTVIVPASSQGPEWLVPVIVVGAIGLIGAAIYVQYRIASTIAQKEGAKGLLAYEGGSAAIGVAVHEFED